MGLPQINIIFKQLASTLKQRASRGIVVMLLKDTTNLGLGEVYDLSDIPNNLKADNKKYLEMALIGNVDIPSKIITYVMGAEDTIDNALEVMETQDFNYMVMPEAIEADKNKIKTWVVKMRDKEGIKVKAILGETAGDHEGIINFATTDISIGDQKFTSDKFIPRVVGAIAGTPLSQAITFVKVKEVTSIPKMTKEEANAAIDAGKLILIRESGSIRFGRGVNSLTTDEPKGNQWRKIKIVDTLDLIHSDCKKVIIDEYIGKVPNSYDNKCLLIVAIQEYLNELAQEQLIEKDFSVDIDVEAQKAYLKSIGVDIREMKEQEIREANTKTHVFLKANLTVLDAVEDVNLVFNF